MGITKKDCYSLFYASKSGVSFEKVLTLGRLHLYATKKEIFEIQSDFYVKSTDSNSFIASDEYAEPLFKLLGASTIDSIDYSDYEKASFIHDLNLPLPVELKNKYSVVIDSGTLEHVFNFPIGIKNCMEALVVGGYFIGISPANNQLGHGFYQFSPELSYRIFSNKNGFEVKRMFITASDQNSYKWYEVADPEKVNSRVTISNNQPLVLITIAKKIRESEIFKESPQQIDYVNSWNAHLDTSSKIKELKTGKLKYYFRKFMPKKIKSIVYNFRDVFFIERKETDVLGTINTQHFKEVVLSELI